MRILIVLFTILFSSLALGAGYKAKTDPAAKHVETRKGDFRPDPLYKDHKYDAEKNIGIYGNKSDSGEPWYPFFFGRRLYPSGEFNEGLSILGKRNRLYPHLMGFGDLRLAYVYSDDGADEQAEIAARMNLDLDLKLTATERLHAFVRPLDKDGQFTRFSFGDDGFKNEFQEHIDFNLDALFFEGEMGAIWSGMSGSWASFELPFAFGLMPIIFHNGIWINDIFTGLAFTIPAVNSPMLNISNMDVTFFTANDELNTPLASGGNDVADQKVHGFNAFIEWFEGYMELGYAYTQDELTADGDHSYHNTMLSWTKRWKDIASLSYRVVGNFGQESQAVNNADGALFLIETSWMTHRPYELVPYFNLFAGIDQPQSVARAVGGILQNTGILFEADGMTSFPTMDATGADTWGGALGIQYIPGLINYQIVFEIASVQPHGNKANTTGDEYGAGIRFQKPFGKAFIFRIDGIYASRDNQEEIWGARTELRWKF